jgi:hypothetical protein
MTKATLGKIAGRSVTLLVLTAAPILTGSSPASAHANLINHGNDYARVDGEHDDGYVCDEERDGNYVRVDMLDIFGQVRSFRDAGGADGTCDPFSHNASRILQWRMCEEGVGCTPYEEI